jgi:hypothetical protein
MELFARRPRPTHMKLYPAITAVGLAALAGCGTYVANGAAAGSGTTASTASNTTATGCASVADATKVTALRAMHLVEPTRADSMVVTQTNPATVRALFRDFCQVVSHKSSRVGVECPMDIGLAYGGTFYDGTRPLASYTFAATGCEIVSVTSAAAGAKPDSAMVIGAAAAAAPNLRADMAKVLGQPQSQVFMPPSTHIVQGSGPSK